jgi:hypothetical protein
MVGLIGERLRRLAFALIVYLVLGTGALAGIWLALKHPPVALATSLVLFVTLLYRAVTSPYGSQAQNWHVESGGKTR